MNDDKQQIVNRNNDNQFVIVGKDLILDIMPIVDIDKRMYQRVNSLKYDYNDQVNF